MTDKELQDFIKHGETGFVEFAMVFGDGWARHAIEIAKELRSRLAQPEPLPAKSKGALSHEENKQHNKKILDKFYEENAHLYTTPPQEPLWIRNKEGKLELHAPPQEPLAWANPNDLQNFDMKVRTNGGPLHTVPLYTSPPAQREWQGLTDLENAEFVKTMERGNFLVAIYDIEKKLKEKNT
jgi:hypothetical protein